MLVAGSCRQCVLTCLTDLHRPARLLQLTSCVLKACPCLRMQCPGCATAASCQVLPGVLPHAWLAHAAVQATAPATPGVSSARMAGQCPQSRCGQPSLTDCMSLLLQTLFKVSPAAALDILKVAKSVLEHWYATYMQVREKIEISGRDARWEFSKQMLFERTNFMVCACHLPKTHCGWC